MLSPPLLGWRGYRDGKVVGDSSDGWGIIRSRPTRRSVSALAPQLGSRVILRRCTTLVKALGGPPLTWFYYAISGDCSGELLCLFFPLSRLELLPVSLCRCSRASDRSARSSVNAGASKVMEWEVKEMKKSQACS